MSEKIQTLRRDTMPLAGKFCDGALRGRLRAAAEPLALEIPSGGAKSIVYVVNFGGRPRAIVHGFNKSRRFARMVAALRFSQKHNLPAPHLIAAENWWLARLRNGIAFVASEFLHGRTLDWKTPASEIAAPLAEALARLHAVQNRHWGRPGALRRGSILEDWRRCLDRRLKESGGVDGRPNAAEHAGIANGLRERLAALPEPAEFHLCHHHLAPDDMIFDADARTIRFIDCGSLQFSRASRDLAALRLTIFRDEAPGGPGSVDWRGFLDMYFERMPQTSATATREATEQELDFFYPYLLLSKLRRLKDGEDREGIAARLLACANEGALEYTPDGTSVGPPGL